MSFIEAVYDGEVFRPRDAIDLEAGSHVELELKTVHAPGLGESRRSWEPHSLPRLEAEVLRALDHDRLLDLEELSRHLGRNVNWRKATAEPAAPLCRPSALIKPIGLNKRRFDSQFGETSSELNELRLFMGERSQPSDLNYKFVVAGVRQRSHHQGRQGRGP